MEGRGLRRVTCVEENDRTEAPEVDPVVEADPFLPASYMDDIWPPRLSLATTSSLQPILLWLEGQRGQTVETRGRDKEPEAEQPEEPPVCLPEKALMR